MKVAVLGSGVVGEVLANGFLKFGHDVMRASREPAKLEAWRGQAGAKAQTGDFAAAARFAEVVVLAVKGTAAESAVRLCGSALDGKVVIDATNPIADLPPVNGVLQFFTGPNESLMERSCDRAPLSIVVHTRDSFRPMDPCFQTFKEKMRTGLRLGGAGPAFRWLRAGSPH